MGIEFDADKDEINRFKHRLSLSFGKRIFADPDHFSVASHRKEDGEDRSKAMGMVEGKLYTTVYIWRDDVLRLISVRRSNAGEQRDYNRYSSRPK
jgi:uncharacterized protein